MILLVEDREVDEVTGVAYFSARKVRDRRHERFLVQCQQWRAQQVGVAVVRELYGVMAAEHVAGGYVVTSGSFTKDAKEFAEGRNIESMDGTGVSAVLRDTGRQ